MEQASTQSCRDLEPGTRSLWRLGHHVRLCREAFLNAFHLGRLQKFEDELVRNSLRLVEKRVTSALSGLRSGGTVLNLDAHRKACRHITRSMTTDPGLHEELAGLECMPLDRHSVRLHLAALDRSISRELRALVSTLSGESCDAESLRRSSSASAPDSSIRIGRAMCRHCRRDNSSYSTQSP